MGRRGPKVEAGSRRSNKLASAEPPPESLSLPTVPPCPATLDGEAAEAWVRFARLAYDSGRLTAADLPALELLCLTWAEFLAASEIANDPVQCYVFSEKGGVYSHPAVGRQSSTRKQLTVLFARFGLTPLDRVQVGGTTSTKKQGSGLAAFAAARSAGG